ncbi:phosphatidate cytidylyltransferase, partial [Chloroflexota bacterium]
MLRQRILSAVVLTPPIIAAVRFGDVWLSLLAAAFAVLAFGEFHDLLSRGGYRPLAIPGTALTFAFIADAHYGGDHTAPILAAAVTLPLVWLLLSRERGDAFVDWTSTLAAAVYLGLLLGLWV